MSKANKANRLTDYKLKKMKTMFMDYKNPSQIAKELGCGRSTVVHHIKKWDDEREMKKAELFQTMTEAKRVEFTSMTQATITIMTKALNHLANRDEPPSMQEATKASEILSTLDRITRLDDGNPTDIISKDKPLTIVEVQKRISMDPFAKQIETVPYEEKEEDEPSNNN